MDFLSCAELAATLVNTELSDESALSSLLTDRSWLQPAVTATDVAELRVLQVELRPVFSAATAGEVGDVVSGLNELLASHAVRPMISDHDPDDLHLQVADRGASVSELLAGECLMGLATVVCDLGATRLGVCSAERCDSVFVDTSPNQSRRYCSERCSSRANVAAYRARQRAATA